MHRSYRSTNLILWLLGDPPRQVSMSKAPTAPIMEQQLGELTTGKAVVEPTSVPRYDGENPSEDIDMKDASNHEGEEDESNKGTGEGLITAPMSETKDPAPSKASGERVANKFKRKTKATKAPEDPISRALASQKNRTEAGNQTSKTKDGAKEGRTKKVSGEVCRTSKSKGSAQEGKNKKASEEAKTKGTKKDTKPAPEGTEAAKASRLSSEKASPWVSRAGPNAALVAVVADICGRRIEIPMGVVGAACYPG